MMTHENDVLVENDIDISTFLMLIQGLNINYAMEFDGNTPTAVLVHKLTDAHLTLICLRYQKKIRENHNPCPPITEDFGQTITTELLFRLRSADKTLETMHLKLIQNEGLIFTWPKN